MRAVIQRVSNAKVEVDSHVIGEIDTGLLVYLSVAKTDTEKDARFIAEKLANLRIFPDEQGKMNLSVRDVSGNILVVSNFTLHGNCLKGRRPGFDQAARPELAEKLYEKVAALLTENGLRPQTGKFAAHMHVTSTNDGPVTFIIDTK